MPRKIKRIISIILLITILCLCNKTLAMTVGDLSPTYTSESEEISNFGKELFGIIRNIAVISSVVILAYIGLKFMFGSVDQKAEYKKSLMPLAIGVFVVLSATTITSLVWKIL